MNKKNIIKSILVFLILSLIFTNPILNKLIIQSKINQANYCNIKSDCIDIGGKCPFGCYIYVNKEEAKRCLI
jgi:hypothetical protein